MRFFKGLMRRVAYFGVLLTCVFAASVAWAQSVVVRGNSRVDAETIRSYFNGTSPEQVNQGYKDLLATGLFSDVKITHAGGHLVVTVRENNLINRVAFEGNSKVKTEQLAAEIQSKSRGPYSPTIVEADRQRILDIYRRAGRADATVTYRTVPLPNGRVDVVFTINEGDKTGVRDIRFVGNHAYSSYRLRNLMQTTEMNFLSFLKTTDVYDPDRISADEELIRRFYLKHGYADFRITGSDAHYDAAKKGYIITITVDEGQPYRISSVNIESHLPSEPPAALKSAVLLSAGDTYDGDLVQKSVEALTRRVAKDGYAFANVTPRADRDPATHTIALGFVVEEGPRVYIQSINIHGNTRTRDYVIRREFDLAPGDAYNKVLIDRAERRLNALGFFKKVTITNEPGSAPDRVIIDVNVQDQPTGSFGVSGGYSTTDGFIAELSVQESNFLGRGQFVRAAVSLGQYGRGVDFSFTEPYFLGYRMAAGFDLFAKNSNNLQYSVYTTRTVGGTVRLGLPITDELTFGARYSLYQTNISIPNDTSHPYNDCTAPITGITPGTTGYVNPSFPGNGNAQAKDPSWQYNCVTNGEASLAVKASQGSTLSSVPGYTFTYNTLDNPKNPTEGIYAQFGQDAAGLGGQSKFVRTTAELRYYHPIYDDIVGMVRLQGGDEFTWGGNYMRLTDNFNLGPSLVRGFAPGGIGPRDVSDPNNTSTNSLGGTKYWGATAEVQFPIFGMPKELGLKGALFADAGSLWGYEGQTNFTPTGGGACTYYTYSATAVAPYTNTTQGSCIKVQDYNKIRSSVGASLIWASPLGPIRFDYAFVLSKAAGDQTQAFRFSGGTSF